MVEGTQTMRERTNGLKISMLLLLAVGLSPGCTMAAETNTSAELAGLWQAKKPLDLRSGAP